MAAVAVEAPMCNLQDGPAAAEEAETAAALESGCCSAAAVIWGRKCEDNEGAAIKTSNTENQKDGHKRCGQTCTQTNQTSPNAGLSRNKESNGVWLD